MLETRHGMSSTRVNYLHVVLDISLSPFFHEVEHWTLAFGRGTGISAGLQCLSSPCPPSAVGPHPSVSPTRYQPVFAFWLSLGN